MPAVIPHKHCVVCGKAIEPDETFCSKACKTKYEEDRKRQRNFMIFMFAILFAVFILMIFSTR